MDTQQAPNPQQHAPVQYAPAPYPQYIQDDEIDLFELVGKLWARKLTIATITAVISVGAAAVALLLPPTWQTETRAYVTSPANLAHLNDLQQQIGIGATSANGAFTLYSRYLNSQATSRSVFQESGLAAQALEKAGKGDNDRVLADGFEAFNKNLAINHSNPKKNIGQFITIGFDAQSQPFSAQLINDYLLPSARAKTIAVLTTELSTALTQGKAKLLRQITQIEQQFIESASFKTLELTDALDIARAGGLNSFISDRFTTINAPTLFMLGTDILTKQLEQQKDEMDKYRLISVQGKNDTGKPMLANVIPLYLKLQRLENLEIDLSQLQPVTIDEPAQVPATPIKPKKSLIVALGVILGGMLGVFIALIQIAVANRKEKMTVASDN